MYLYLFKHWYILLHIYRALYISGWIAVSPILYYLYRYYNT